MSDDAILVVVEPPEPVVLVVEQEEPTVLVVQEEAPAVLVVQDAPGWTFKTTLTVSNTAPGAPNVGDIWIDTN